MHACTRCHALINFGGGGQVPPQALPYLWPCITDFIVELLSTLFDFFSSVYFYYVICDQRHRVLPLNLYSIARSVAMGDF